MFFKHSRYRKLPDEVTVDYKGRRLPSKRLRELPTVTGVFSHTIEDSDRLDHLAYKYYQQPRNWWRICDANPEFMSPQELLGKTPIVTQRFPLSYTAFEDSPAWAMLLTELASQVGVDDVWLSSDETFITVTFNHMNVQSSDLAGMLEAAGFTVESPQTISRTGKQITIPPNVVG